MCAGKNFSQCWLTDDCELNVVYRGTEKPFVSVVDAKTGRYRVSFLVVVQYVKLGGSTGVADILRAGGGGGANEKNNYFCPIVAMIPISRQFPDNFPAG